MNDKTQGRLLQWATFFLFLQCIILTLSPAVRERSWDVDYRLSHWLGFSAWGILIFFAHLATKKYLPERDPYILPAAALLTGWGLLTIWRLDENFGLRQTVWLGLGLLVFFILLRFFRDFTILRRYKYVILSGGLLITAMTLLFGTNPLGFGPRLWLGCCNVYFQPSEPLKVLVVIYLSAYLADRANIRNFSFPLLLPTLFVTGIALLLLIVQRDLGTASIFVFLFTVMTFIATGKRRILFATVGFLTIALLVGYFAIDLINIRVVGWLNPWNDPAGKSYQIVQSLLAVANGGTLGRGLGIGSPLLVPVAMSDFIYAAIAEESGLVGSLGLIALIWLIVARGLIVALRATDRFRRNLAAGISAYLGIQSLLIIGGNVRMLPLTGVTLPFVSYGGSSLLTSFFALFLLLTISNTEEDEPAELKDTRPFSWLAGVFAIGFAAATLTTGWWAIVRGTDLLTRTDNPRRAIADRFVPRGDLLDKDNRPINITVGESGSYFRSYVYPDLAPVSGYTHPVYGQAGAEAGLDDYLRGLQGNPMSLILWNQLIYGTPPPGLDVRLSIDLTLQTEADHLLGDHNGAIVLLNAQTGEILAMASHPTYDPNTLDTDGKQLSQNPDAPLLNRATQGLYPVGTALLPLIRAETDDANPSNEFLLSLYEELGFFQTPILNIPVAENNIPTTASELRASPLQVALAMATLSNQGTIPAPRLATAVNTPENGWVVLPALDKPREVYNAELANDAALFFIEEGEPYWSHLGQARKGDTAVTWFLAGTLPDWQGTPLSLVVTLEENNTTLAKSIGKTLLDTVIQ